MGKINMQKVIIGGLVAGVVLNVVDFVLFGIVLKDQMAAAMQAIGKPAMSNAQIPWFVFLDFVAGVFLVWLYAAMRPRFGAGPATAAKVGVAGWFLGSLLVTLFMWPMALMPHNLMIITTLVALVQWPLAVVLGARFYTEGAGMGAGMGAGAGMGSR
ncbi:MAG TPA: hypothetical protein VK573_11050 [Gemmatimonadales bacterium]|jgi:hypothetical protein|nr:hypothetical protein [Gemmatimonadales bacterium]